MGWKVARLVAKMEPAPCGRHPAEEDRNLKTRDGKAIARGALIGIVVLVVLVFALIGVLSVTRGTPVQSVRSVGSGGLPAAGDESFARAIQLHTGTTLLPGNEVQLLFNGEGTYPVLWRDLRGARRAIAVQMYYAMPGAVADTMAAILAERARAGVRVLVLLDAFGAGAMRGDWPRQLRAAGATVAWLRPLRWYSLHRAANRSHVRVVLVDGDIGYTGGFGLADYWMGSGLRPGEWRETNVRFRGPAVAQLQATFAAGWAEATGELLTGPLLFSTHAGRPRGTVRAALMHTIPTVGSTPAERYLALTIAGARRTLYVANSYFVPDDDFRRFLTDAVRRGVDVRVLTAGPRSDVQTTLYAGRARYEELLRGGVKIYEYQPAMMHAKTIVVDGMWCSIGTMNFDNRSLAFNDENTLIALDGDLGARMDAMFLADLRHARRITLPEWRRRPWYERAKELGANLVSRVL
ncbi:MAG TPA: phospholipase D-like domain-containing protein [Gemmatimonadaceae bacterium]|nr:phospholipase D-like domain-containing protein [Gemmatimonadaceae bacterium]